jgi:carboxylesterase type B
VTQQVENTQFTGYRDAHIWKFKGIRYAAKPERFQYSNLFIEAGNVSAIASGAPCVQPIGEVSSGTSEDCLFMNIWTPYLPPTTAGSTNITSQLKPVMLYLYGGAFLSGSANNSNAEGTNLASRGDVVVITPNYRVGNLGFLAFNDGVHNGNYALSDMVTALEWVQRYAKYFGGDASRVTLFGESAGALGVHILLGSPKAQGLFHRAIMQSDPTGYANGTDFRWTQYPSIGDSFKDSTTKVLQEAGCLNATDQIACLGKLSGFDLVNLATNVK